MDLSKAGNVATPPLTLNTSSCRIDMGSANPAPATALGSTTRPIPSPPFVRLLSCLPRIVLVVPCICPTLSCSQHPVVLQSIVFITVKSRPVLFEYPSCPRDFKPFSLILPVTSTYFSDHRQVTLSSPYNYPRQIRRLKYHVGYLPWV